MRHSRLAAVVAACVAMSSARAQYGDLAPGGAMSWSLTGVRVEVGVTFVMAPSFVTGRLPRGFRAITLGEMAAGGDSAAKATLARHPDFASHVLTSLGVSRVDSMAVEGDTIPARPVIDAFWWVPVRLADSSATLPDSRARIGGQVVQLGRWSADSRFARRLGAVIPGAVAAPLTVTWDGAGGWRVRLTLPDASVIGSCHLVGARAPMHYPLPAFSTVWVADSVAGPFTVFTYYGHQTQRCTGSWRAKGDAPLARALQTGAILNVENQSEWRARAAAYGPPR